MTPGSIRLFALHSNRDFGEQVADALGLNLSQHEERDFEDGEHKARPLENVRGCDVYIIESLHSDQALSVNDKLCRLLFFCGALRDASAARVTLVIPYLAYARKDRRTKARDPVTTRYLAQLIEAVGVNHVIGLDVHNTAAFQNAFRIPTDHLEARPLLAAHFARALAGRSIVVVSPDIGGVKRAQAFAATLAEKRGSEVALAFLEKQRSEGVVSGEALIGDVAGCEVLLLDDLISTGTTLLRAAKNCLRHGANAVHAAATHGVFTGEAPELLSDPALDSVTVTDSLPPGRLGTAKVSLTTLSTAPLFAEAIRRAATGGSLVELLSDSDLI